MAFVMTGPLLDEGSDESEDTDGELSEAVEDSGSGGSEVLGSDN